MNIVTFNLLYLKEFYLQLRNFIDKQYKLRIEQPNGKVVNTFTNPIEEWRYNSIKKRGH